MLVLFAAAANDNHFEKGTLRDFTFGGGGRGPTKHSWCTPILLRFASPRASPGPMSLLGRECPKRSPPAAVSSPARRVSPARRAFRSRTSLLSPRSEVALPVLTFLARQQLLRTPPRASAASPAGRVRRVCLLVPCARACAAPRTTLLGTPRIHCLRKRAASERGSGACPAQAPDGPTAPRHPWRLLTLFFVAQQADSTQRSSQAVPHPSTNRALCRLTSEVGRDPVYSTRYGRQRH